MNLIRTCLFRMIGLILIAGLLHPIPCYAFKQKYHEKMTEDLLTSRGYDIESADEAGDSNYNTDLLEPHVEAAHADNNMLHLASARLRYKIDAIIRALKAGDKREALDLLGEALHTVQDTYSHSNAVDNNFYIQDILAMRRGTAHCDASNNFAPSGLVTGYFNLATFIIDQCIGKPANDCCHEQLNKDSPSQLNGWRFDVAYDEAYKASDRYVAKLESEILKQQGGQALLDLLKRKVVNIAFVVDDSGSMGMEIDSVKNSLIETVNNLKGSGNALRIGLTTFSHRVSHQGDFYDPDEVINRLSNISASGGLPCVEKSYQAVEKALLKFPSSFRSDLQHRGGNLILVTDETPDNAELESKLVNMAKKRKVKIHTIVTTSGPAECNKGGTVADYYRNLSRRTGGTFLSGNDVSTGAMSDIALLQTTQGLALMSTQEYGVSNTTPPTPMPTPKVAKTSSASFKHSVIVAQADYPVLLFIAEVKSGTSSTAKLIAPSGKKFDASQKNIIKYEFGSSVAYKIDRPHPGTWSLAMTGSADLGTQISTYANNPIELMDVKLLQKKGTQAARAEQIPVSAPLVGEPLTIEVRFDKPVKHALLKLRKPDGTVVYQGAGTLDPSDYLTAVWDLTTGPGEVMLEVLGQTDTGRFFRRTVDVPIEPSVIRMSQKATYVSLLPGETQAVHFIVENLGNRDEILDFDYTRDLNGWSLGTPPTSFTVPPKTYSYFDIHITNESQVFEGSKQMVEFSVTNQDGATPAYTQLVVAQVNPTVKEHSQTYDWNTQGAPGRKFELEVTNAGLVEIDVNESKTGSYLELVDENDETLASDPGWTSKDTRVVKRLEPGRYTINVSSWLAHPMGGFKLEVKGKEGLKFRFMPL